MKEEIRIPKIGESITNGILTTWLKKNGERVEEGEEIFELETEKTTLEVPAPVAGVLETLVNEDDEVEVGQQVAWIDTEAEPREAEPPAADAATEAASEKEAAAADSQPPAAEKPLSPAVRRVVAEAGLDPSRIEGTGKDGRITKEDALNAAEAAGGKEEAVQERAPAPEPVAPPSVPAPATGDGDRPQTRKRMSLIRRKTAERLVEARQNAAHLTTFNQIDMQSVMDLRATYRDEFEKTHGIRLGFMSFFVKACCRALQAYPDVNTEIDGEEIVYKHFYDIGVAISLDRGLVVPVVRGADKLSFADVEKAITDLAQRARGKKLLPDELTGGTFSITNGGVFGSLLSTPIPAYPQAAILGMHAIEKRPVVVDDEIRVRPMMYVALSYDHRVIDGRDAIGFLVKVKELVEDPQRLMLDL